MSIGRSTGSAAASSRAIGGLFGPSSSISSDCTISAFGSSGLTSVTTSPPSSSVLSSSVVVVELGQDAAPVLDPVQALLRAGHPRRAGVDVVDPHPAVDEAQPQLGPGAVERACCTSVQPPAPVGAPLAERRRRRRHGEHAAAEDDRRGRRGAGQLADLGLGRAAAERDGDEPPVGRGGHDGAGAAPGCCRTRGDGLPSAPGTSTSSGVGPVGGGQTRSPSGSASTAVSSPSDVIDATPSVSSTPGWTSVVPSGRGTRRCRRPRRRPRRGRRAWPPTRAPSPVTSASTSSVDGDRQQLLAVSFHTPIDAWSTISAPPSTAWTVDVLADADAGRVGDALDGVVDDGDGAGRAVVDDDDPGAWSTSKSEPGSDDADGGGDLADLAVDVTHVPRVALQQPRPAVVGVGPRALAPLRLQGGDDDGADDEAEHDEDAAGHAAPGAPRHRASCPCRSLLLHRLLAWPLHRRSGRCVARRGTGADAVSADDT